MMIVINDDDLSQEMLWTSWTRFPARNTIVAIYAVTLLWTKSN